MAKENIKNLFIVFLISLPPFLNFIAKNIKQLYMFDFLYLFLYFLIFITLTYSLVFVAFKFFKKIEINFLIGYIIIVFFSYGFIFNLIDKTNFDVFINERIFAFILWFILFLFTFAGAIWQWPIGYLSDRLDRRLIIITCTFAAAIFCVLSIIASGTSLENMYLATSVGIDKIMFYIFVTLYACVSLPIYTLNIAYVNDFISKEKFVAAGGGLQILFGLGAIGGPLLCSLFMHKYGSNGFFIFLFIFHVMIGLFGIYRMTRRSYEENPDSIFTPLPRNITPLGMELDPSTGADLSNSDKK